MKFTSGFTLIEILVVFGILAVLLSIVLIAINPSRLLSKTDDLALRVAIYDLNNASNTYLASEKVYPWEKNSLCNDELASGSAIIDMNECFQEITGFQADKLSTTEKNKYSKIYASKCMEHAVMCYLPSTKEVIEDAIYDKYGVVNPGCPGNGEADCYWCRKTKINEECAGPPESTPSASPTLTLTPIPTISYPPYPGVCVVRDFFTNAPSFFDPDVGVGYAKVIKEGTYTLQDLKNQCSLQDYEDLKENYCSINSNLFQQSVLIFTDSGGPYSTMCGAFGCDAHSCL